MAKTKTECVCDERACYLTRCPACPVGPMGAPVGPCVFDGTVWGGVGVGMVPGRRVGS